MKKNSQILFDSKSVKAYLNGELSKEETIDFEKELEHNPFYKDAVEGLKSNPSGIDSFSKLEYSGRRFYKLNPTTLYSFFAFSFLIIGSVFLMNNKKVDTTSLYSSSVKELILNDQLVQDEKDVTKELLVELTNENIEKSIIKQKEKQVQSEKIVKDYELKIKQKDSVLKVENILVKQLVEITQKPMKTISTNKSKELQTEKIPLISMHGLINVDYSKIETNLIIKKKDIKLTGLPANAESSINKNYEPSHEMSIKQIPYEAYLSNIQHYFSRNQFKKALKGYKEILNQHPNDLNAHFYSGLCYYNINQSKKALEHFNKVETHQYDIFRQEGEWYTAQALYDLGRDEETITILNKIIKRNGFYAAQALEMKKELK